MFNRAERRQKKMIGVWRQLNGTNIVCGQPIEFWVDQLPLDCDKYSYSANAFMGHAAAIQHCMERLGPCGGDKFRNMDVGDWLDEMMSLFSDLEALWERGIANNVSRLVMNHINSVYQEWVDNMGKLATDEMPGNLGESN